MRRVMWIACVLAVTACRDDDRPKPPPPPIDGIELVKPGAEPRRALRYQLAANTTSALDLAMDVDLKTREVDLKLPAITLALDLAITAVEADGTATLKMTVVGGGATARSTDERDRAALQVMDRQSKLLVGLVVAYRLAPSGQVTDPKLEASGRDLSGPMQEQIAMLLQASEQLAMALPDKPVGVGAVWKHRRTMKQNQLTLVTTTHVEVVAIDGDTITFQSTTEMTGADQVLAQGSATAQVTNIRGTGSQRGRFDLAKAIVIGETTATIGFEMIAGGERRPTKLDLVTRFAPRASDAQAAEVLAPSDAGPPDDAGASTDAGAPIH